jgi:hypothetical protein
MLPSVLSPESPPARAGILRGFDSAASTFDRSHCVGAELRSLRASKGYLK